MYCFFCGKQLEIAKLITSKDRENKEKQIQIACIECNMHVQRKFKKELSDKEAAKELELEFIEFTAYLVSKYKEKEAN